MTPDEKRARLFSLLHSFEAGMLVTHGRDGTLHARPMVQAEVDAAGDIWLLSDAQTQKVDELLADPRVAMTLQDGPRFVALTGRAEVVRDAARVQRLWRPAWSRWFPHGPDHPDTVLLAVRTVAGHFWDHSGEQPVRHLLGLAEAWLGGGPAPAAGAVSGGLAL